MTDVDHRPAQEAEAAAAAKTKEAMEAILRLLQQRAEQAKQSGTEPQAGSADNTPYAPSEKDAQLYQNFYDAYREHGVDVETAQAAAADAALGLGAAESPAIQQAEAQVLQTVQQAQAYRTAATAAVDPERSPTEQQQADADRKELERDLWGDEKPSVQERAEFINQLDPPNRQPAQLPDEQLPPEAKNKPVSKERFRSSLQSSYEKSGARPATAQAASYEVVNKAVGAADGPAVKQAHQEIAQHKILRDLYQGVYEKSGVSPALATQAADQMARGNGANRSAVVRQAHDQALGNLSSAQNVSPEQAAKGHTQRPETNRAPDTAPPEYQQSEPLTQKEQPAQTPKPIPKAKTTASAAETQPTENNSSEPTLDSLWQQHSPTEQGNQLRPQADYQENAALVDSHFAYNALAAGATVTETKDALLRNSPEANGMETQDAATYTDRVISRANKELSAPQTTTPDTEQTQEQPAVTASEPTTESAAGNADATSSTDSAKPDEPTDTADTKQPQLTVSQTSSQPKLTAQQLYSQFSNTENSGVFAAVTKSNLRAKDLEIAQNALMAGHTPKEVRAAIAEQSPHSKQLSGGKSYARRTVNNAQETSTFRAKAPEIIWTQQQAKQGQETLSDQQVARRALAAGYKPEQIEQAIAQHSPLAQAAPNANQYGESVMQTVNTALEEEKLGKQPDKQTNKEKKTERQQDSKRASNKKESQDRQPSKQKVRKQAKSKDQGIEM